MFRGERGDGRPWPRLAKETDGARSLAFHRAELADQILGTLAHGPAQALSIFAPRRAGKTEFLVQDLAPNAEAKGHGVIYASFWQAPLSPLAVLLHVLEPLPEDPKQDDLAVGGAAREAVGTVVLVVVRVDGFPAEMFFQVVGHRPLDEGVFGIKGDGVNRLSLPASAVQKG